MMMRRKPEHPRARGENLAGGLYGFFGGGTSPRTRGKPLGAYRLLNSDRNIPAHAGKTATFPSFKAAQEEHPRARGENYQLVTKKVFHLGTSPRTRGKHLLTCGSSFLKVILHSVLFSRTMGV